MKIKAEGSFEAAHLLSMYEGKCANLHGHTYLYEVEIEGYVDEHTGMVVDFNEVKAVFDEYDHAFLVSEHPVEAENTMLGVVQAWNMRFKIIAGSTRTTVEYIAKQLTDELKSLSSNIQYVKLKLWETPKHCVEVEA